MFNVAIFKMKDITKNLIAILIIILIIINIRFFVNKKEIKITVPTGQIYKKAINKQIPLVEELEKNQEEHTEENKELKYAKIAIGTEISAIKGLEEKEKESETTNATNNEEQKNRR